MATTNRLDKFRVAILVTDGFEEAELTEPRHALSDAGATTMIVSLPQSERVQGMNHNQKAGQFPVDNTLDKADSNQFDALLLPGGVGNPDVLRTHPTAVQFVRAFYDGGKPIAAICHGPWMLVEADLVRGRLLTSWPSLRTDITNAGGNWVDQPNVTDGQITTSRKPADLQQFNAAMLQLFEESVRRGEFETTRA